MWGRAISRCRVPRARRAPALRLSSLATNQPWVVEPSDPELESRVTASLAEHGFAILPGFLQPEALAKLQKPLLERTDEMLGLLQAKQVKLGVGSRVGFSEVVLRSDKRYDVPCDFEELPADVVGRIERITGSVMAGTAGPDGTANPGQSRAFAGVVRAEPGCSPQEWHADSPHHSEQHAPPHILNVLVALREVTPEDGPTEIIPGSHVLTNHLRPSAAFDADEIVYQNPNSSPSTIGAQAQPVAAVMPAGSALIFDDRALHRGGGNASTRVRDVAFLSYCRPPFTPATHYEAVRSLRRYDHRAIAAEVREEFPGLTRGSARGSAGQPVVADGASGSQVHASVVEAMAHQLRYGSANVGGLYDSSREVNTATVRARAAMADFLNCRPEETVFGASMTALTFHLARALRGYGIGPGDNIVLDPLSHGANVWPWVQLARACGAEVRWLPLAAPLGRCTIDVGVDALARVIDPRTRLVACGAASNGVGSVHDVQTLCTRAGELSTGRALRFVDAVHFAPHFRIDVAAIGCDLLACSPYKFFGPHAGVLFGRRRLLESLPVDRLECADDGLPREESGHMSRWEVGTQNFEAFAGVAAAVDYLAGLGARFGGAGEEQPRGERLEAAWRAIEAHEAELKVRFLEGAAGIRGLRLLGVEDPASASRRTSTFAVAAAGKRPDELAAALCERAVWCTAGNHYTELWAACSGGLADNATGMTRISFLHYNTLEDVDRVLATLEEICT